MQSQNFRKVDFPHDALHFMILQQFVNTDESLGLPALFQQEIDQMVRFL